MVPAIWPIFARLDVHFHRAGLDLRQLDLEAAAAAVLNIGEDILHDVVLEAVLRLEFVIHLVQGVRHLANDVHDQFIGRTVLDLDLRHDEVAAELREEGDLDEPSADEADHHDRDRDERRERRPAKFDRPGQERLVDLLDEALEPHVHPVGDTAPGSVGGTHDGEVGRQNELALDQRERKAKDDDPGDGARHRRRRSRLQEHRRERHYRGEHPERRGHGHALGTPDDVAERIAVFFGLGVRALRDDDRIVHHDPEHQDEREQAHDVDRHVHERHRHHHERAEERHRQPDDHPGGDLEMQEHAEDDEHEDRPQGHVLQHHVDAALEVEGVVGPSRHLRLGRQGLVALGDEFLHRGAHVDGILLLGGHHVDAERTFAVEEGVALHLGELVADLGHVAEPDARPVRPCEQDDLLVFKAGVGLSGGPQADVAGLGSDRAARQID